MITHNNFIRNVLEGKILDKKGKEKTAKKDNGRYDMK